MASYLQEGPEGKFYYRMVDTVLTRDHNWVRWKSESCPEISRPPVSAADFLETQKASTRIFANKRLRPVPMGALDVSFLDETKAGGLEALKQPERYVYFPLSLFFITRCTRAHETKPHARFRVPNSDSYMRGIADDEFNMDMTNDPEEKEEAKKAKTSKAWRTLRLASRERFLQFAKIQDCKNLDALFASEPDVSLQATSSSTPAVTVEEKEKVEQTELKELERRKSVVAGDGSASGGQEKGQAADHNEDTKMEDLHGKTPAPPPEASEKSQQAGDDSKPTAANDSKTDPNPPAQSNAEAKTT